MNFRTTNGVTTFCNANNIAAYTKTAHLEIDVHMCSGTIFTICKEESNKFIRWIEALED